MKRKILLKRLGYTLLTTFILINIVAYFHAYKFTHFSDNLVNKTKDAKKLTTPDKVKALFFGVDNPRPINRAMPTQLFNTITLHSNKDIECWNILTENSKGTVILFHGYGGEKSSLLDKSDEFIKQGFSTLLVDFMGSGGSAGNQTTIGYKEAEEVKTCYDYLRNNGERRIYLFGTSLGAVAILKAINDYSINPEGIIIECPFGSMYKTTCARFNTMKVPAFPMAALLDFWGGIQNGFWAFGHQPTEYAKSVKCATLLLYGEKDEKVSRQEIDQIYANLACKKYLKTYPLAGHENYLRLYKKEWVADIAAFINGSSTLKIKDTISKNGDTIVIKNKDRYDTLVKYKPVNETGYFVEVENIHFKGKLDFSNYAFKKKYMTVTTNGVKKYGVNFAGHYCFVFWGCGSPCKLSAVVDLKTGKVYNGLESAIGYSFKKNSRLIVVNPPDSTNWYDITIPYIIPEEYIWTGKGFKIITRAAKK